MIYVVIAAYNEGEKIVQVIKGLNKEGYKNIVVVDDGSADNTFASINKTNATALRHIINRGQGAALKTGIDYAVNQGADYIVTFDADGQHQAKDIKLMVNTLKKTHSDAALGSRFLKKDSNTPFIRKVLLKMGVFMLKFLYGAKLTDSHNGFRVLTRNAAIKIQITSDRMEHASQIIEEIVKKKIKYVEVPVTITYTDYSKQKGQSSWNSVRIGLKMIFRKLTN